MSTTPVSDVFNKGKAWYQSKTIIGVIISAIGALINAFKPEWGFNLGETVTDGIDTADSVAQAADVGYGVIMEIVGLATAFYGRIVAKSKIE